MPAKFRRAARWREREIGCGGLVISLEMSAATELSACGAGVRRALRPLRSAPLFFRSIPAAGVAADLVEEIAMDRGIGREFRVKGCGEGVALLNEDRNTGFFR